MKTRLILLVAIASMAWLVASGCSEKKIDTAKVREALQSLTGDSRQNLDQGLKAIDEGNYAAAERPLKNIAYKVKLNKSQAAILEDTINQAEARAARQK